MSVLDFPASTDFAADWSAWHKQHEARLAAPDGFLAITSINWLTETPTRFPDAPGEWAADDSGITVDLAPGEELTLDGTRITGLTSVTPRATRVPPADIARRGTPAYAPDPLWVIRGRYRPFEPFDEPRNVTVGSVVEGLQHVYAAPGAVEFEVDGQPLGLTAFNGFTPGSLHILFTDATSGVTTYAANRSLQVAAPDADGTVILDFNRATNLPCAYTEFATCPLPPAENRLPVAVEAGEQIPYEAKVREA